MRRDIQGLVSALVMPETASGVDHDPDGDFCRRSTRVGCSLAPRPRVVLRLRGSDVQLGERTLVVGILNCTPDSFFAAGRSLASADAVARYHELVAEGADWIDVGGESTRPGAAAVDAAEEWRRIEPVVAAARQAGHPVPLSVDTSKSAVAARALDAGAAVINDVSALRFDAGIAPLVARHGAGLILMHMQGTPRTMQAEPRYGDVAAEIVTELAESVGRAVQAGVTREQIIVDPGIGFGKTASHNLEILRRLAEFSTLGRPVLIGCSRKSFLGAVLDLPAEERLEGSLAAHAAAIVGGAHLVRVHDVRAHVRMARVLDAVLAAGPA
jgi:dihydropteroate synthase